MKRLFLAVMLLGFVCSCASTPEHAPMFESRFHTEKDMPLPNGWLLFTDGFYKAPTSFSVEPFVPQTRADRKNPDPKANTFTVRTGESPSLYHYSGYYSIQDDTIIDVCAEAAGKGQFSLGIEFCDGDKNSIGDRHQGFEIISAEPGQFKNYSYRLYFLANENRRARYVRLIFIVDPKSELSLKSISLDITPYEVNAKDSTYVKFQDGKMKTIRQ